MSVNIFLKIEGHTGESVKKGYEGWSELLSCSFGGTQSGTMHIGTGGGAGKANIQDIMGVKYVDKVSSALFQSMCTGDHFPKAEVHVCKVGGQGQEMLPYVKYLMEEVLCTSLSQTPSDGTDLVTESFSLNFAKITYTYTPQKGDGSPDAEIPKTFNIRTNAAE